jgi:hypothetical protein
MYKQYNGEFQQGKYIEQVLEEYFPENYKVQTTGREINLFYLQIIGAYEFSIISR